MSGEHRLTEWVTCRCGKEVQRTVRESTPELAEKFMELQRWTLCHSCSADLSREMDDCPESISRETGVAMCGRGWGHTGRCEPCITLEQIEEALRRG